MYVFLKLVSWSFSILFSHLQHEVPCTGTVLSSLAAALLHHNKSHYQISFTLCLETNSVSFHHYSYYKIFLEHFFQFLCHIYYVPFMSKLSLGFNGLSFSFASTSLIYLYKGTRSTLGFHSVRLNKLISFGHIQAFHSCSNTINSFALSR